MISALELGHNHVWLHLMLGIMISIIYVNIHIYIYITSGLQTLTKSIFLFQGPCNRHQMRFHIGCLWFHHRTEWPPKDHSHVAASRRPVFVLDGNASWDFLSWLAKDDEPFYSFILQLLERPNKHGTRWAPTSYKWGYHSTYTGDMIYKPSYPFKIYKAIYRGYNSIYNW